MKDFFQLREAVKSADKKPENYTDPNTGKTKTRMVPVDKEVVKTEAKDPREYDYEGDMAKTQLKTMIDAAKELHDMMGDNDNLPEWVQSKITKAVDYIDSVRDYMKSESDDEDEDDNEDEEMNETKAAPKGFHFTKDGKLKRGDADQDGPGGRMLRADPLDKQRSKVPPVSEKTLTPAEKKKREEIAKAMERENPGMDMSKKMAIATATAKRVAESVELDEVSQELANRVAKKRQDQALDLRQKAVDEPDMSKSFAHSRAANKASHKAGQTYTRMSRKSLKDMMRKEEVELDEKAYVSSLSPEMGRKGSHDVIGKDGKVVKSYPYTKDGMKAAQAHLSKMKEEVELDEVSDKLKQRYINRAMGDHQHANAVRKDAESTGKSDLAAKMKARMKKRNQGMTRAFGGERD